MRDPHTVPPTLTALPECHTEPEPEPGPPSPLPSCPACGDAPHRISWRQRPGEPVVLVFDPCGHRHTSPAPPILAVTAPI
ncbi:hypothetical protein [Streptomyces sp. RerS4]|uniref:hypothetical protein n=1 Tax=Streptomyces sp. RerS4 TaxID=2942449 RepID=UPI00201C9E0D|nr:hypothetical protein [Streptomyces sp. RerS4]UQX04349.1 hypothetical protein M4D82_30475 [Streptomyces sp. RerS4]